MAKGTAAAPKTVDRDIVAQALAKAVYDGDIVNLRLLFMPFSPARTSSTESFDMPKYAYLLPDEETLEDRDFRDCLSLVTEKATFAYIQQELDANRPAQLPSELLLPLADNAVTAGKYTSAAQAYEMLRIRGRMQRMFYEQADVALDANDIPKAVRGYIIAAGLAYDYAAFPEPLPMTPDYQTRALLLHADYPEKPEDALPLREPRVLLQTALSYLLTDAEAAPRLDSRPDEVRVAFLRELVRQQDSRWDDFVARYQNACDIAREFGARLDRRREETGLAGEIEEQLEESPRAIPAALLGREIENGEWWQYLKELASEHPAAVLFVARQAVGTTEILLPRFRPDSHVTLALGISKR